MTRIIGIGGRLASGKDCIADYLVEHHGWVKLGMSDALAEALYTLDPFIPEAHQERWHLHWWPVFRSQKLSWVRYPKFLRYKAESWIRYQPLVDVEGYVKAKENDEVRRLLQVLGTEVGRKQISESVWTDIAARKVRQAESQGVPGAILTGVRFPNEIEMIEELGGETWWVDRPSLTATSNAGHASENSLSSVDFDRTIRNDGTLEDLYKKIDDILD